MLLAAPAQLGQRRQRVDPVAGQQHHRVEPQVGHLGRPARGCRPAPAAPRPPPRRPCAARSPGRRPARRRRSSRRRPRGAAARTRRASSGSTPSRGSLRRGPKQVSLAGVAGRPAPGARAAAACRRRSRGERPTPPSCCPTWRPSARARRASGSGSARAPVCAGRLQRLGVDVGEHQHVAARRVLDDAGDERARLERQILHRQAASGHLLLDLGDRMLAVVEDRGAPAPPRRRSSAPPPCRAAPPAPPEAITGTRDRVADPPQQLEVVPAAACRPCRCW